LVVRGRQRERVRRWAGPVRIALAILFFALLPHTLDHRSALSGFSLDGVGYRSATTVAAFVSAGNLGTIGRDVDRLTTGSVTRRDAVNRAGKADLLISPPIQRASISAGVVGEVALFAPVEPSATIPAATFSLPKRAPEDTTSVSETASIDQNAPATATPTPATPVLLSYAPANDNADGAPFDAVIGDKLILDPDIGANHAWLNTAIPAAARSEKEIRCLATAIYFEARGEPERGQLAVAQVVLNRLKNPAYPSTICNVVYQNQNMRNRCQFSFACDGIKERITDQRSWAQSQALAKRVLEDEKNLYMAEIGAATHYHATYVRPRWARAMRQAEKIGHHIFYTTYGGGWS